MKDLCRQLGISDEQALDIVKSQFRKLKITMTEYNYEEENYPIIALPKWGKFFVKPGKKKNYGNK